MAGTVSASGRSAPESAGADQGFEEGGAIFWIVLEGAAVGVLCGVLGGAVSIVPWDGLLIEPVAAAGGTPVGGTVVERAVTGAVGAAAVVAGTEEMLAAVELEGFSVSFTSATLNVASDTMITTLSARIGARQLAGAARRVRAAAPQPRHQSWSERSGVPHNGHASDGPGGAENASLIERVESRRAAHASRRSRGLRALDPDE
jgi:hypothetical protein